MRWIRWSHLWLEATVVALTALGLIIFLYLQIVAYVQSSNATTVSFAGITLFASSTYLILAAVGLLLLIVLGVAAWIWRGPSLLLSGGWLAALVAAGPLGLQGDVGAQLCPRQAMLAS